LLTSFPSTGQSNKTDHPGIFSCSLLGEFLDIEKVKNFTGYGIKIQLFFSYTEVCDEGPQDLFEVNFSLTKEKRIK